MTGKVSKTEMLTKCYVFVFYFLIVCFSAEVLRWDLTVYPQPVWNLQQFLCLKFMSSVGLEQPQLVSMLVSHACLLWFEYDYLTEA